MSTKHTPHLTIYRALGEIRTVVHVSREDAEWENEWMADHIERGAITDVTTAPFEVFAAAPELLEAAKVTLLGMERFLTQVGAASPEGFDLVGHWREADALRSAIAKAEEGGA